MKNNILLFSLCAAGLAAITSPLAAKDILVCTSPSAPPAIQQGAAAFIGRARDTPFVKALLGVGAAGDVMAQPSEDLLTEKAYKQAANNHLIVIGLQDSDPLLKKVWGHTASIDESQKRFQSLGWGVMEGDIGWVESDRNPFLHSQKVEAVPSGTLLVKIGGTTEAGVLAALSAFEKGMLNGVVTAGPITRPKTTLLDQDPLMEPPPLSLPQELETTDGKKALFAGWSQIPAQEYRSILEAAGSEPRHMWRVKYFAPGFLEEKSLIRWQSGPHRKAYGNAVSLIEFAPDVASGQAVLKMTKGDFKPADLGESVERARQATEATDGLISNPHWKIIVASKGPYALFSTLPPNSTAQVADLLENKSAQ